jgi:hypothetical protein
MNIYTGLLMLGGYISNTELAVSLTKAQEPTAADLHQAKTGNNALKLSPADLTEATCSRC